MRPNFSISSDLCGTNTEKKKKTGYYEHKLENSLVCLKKHDDVNSFFIEILKKK